MMTGCNKEETHMHDSKEDQIISMLAHILESQSHLNEKLDKLLDEQKKLNTICMNPYAVMCDQLRKLEKLMKIDEQTHS